MKRIRSILRGREGMTLVELVVGAGLLCLVIGIFSASLRPAAEVSRRTQELNSAELIADDLLETVRSKVETATDYIKCYDSGTDVTNKTGSSEGSAIEFGYETEQGYNAAELLTALICDGSHPDAAVFDPGDLLQQRPGRIAEEGLQVNILFPSNASDPLTMTAAGRADIGFYYQEDTIIAKANEDVPVKVLGAVVQQPISIVCALAEKNIKTPEDLIGKTIGYSGTRFGEVAVGQMLETVGATLDDVELIDVGFDLMSAMTTGNVDATFGCFINHEVPALEEEGFAVDYMEVMDYGVPNYYALMLVTGEDQLEANRDKYTRFLRACQKGFADMQADPEEALGLLLANQDEENFPLTESVERRSFDVLLPIMETADAPFLSQDVSVWQENIDWLQKVGMIDAAFDPAEVMVDLLAE